MDASASASASGPSGPPQTQTQAQPRVALTPADVRKLMDAALRMQRAGQTAHPKYAQIVALLRQYHSQRSAGQQPQPQAGALY